MHQALDTQTVSDFNLRSEVPQKGMVQRASLPPCMFLGTTPAARGGGGGSIGSALLYTVHTSPSCRSCPELILTFLPKCPPARHPFAPLQKLIFVQDVTNTDEPGGQHHVDSAYSEQLSD